MRQKQTASIWNKNICTLNASPFGHKLIKYSGFWSTISYVQIIPTGPVYYYRFILVYYFYFWHFNFDYCDWYFFFSFLLTELTVDFSYSLMPLISAEKKKNYVKMFERAILPGALDTYVLCAMSTIFNLFNYLKCHTNIQLISSQIFKSSKAWIKWFIYRYYLLLFFCFFFLCNLVYLFSFNFDECNKKHRVSTWWRTQCDLYILIIICNFYYE